ncbi:hypothetical protein SDC9_167941 [bioreactor metagenome]|uniref:F5/8 type C domain-containing protein n=1 Tax=bioreactor metagenome TaxID=1076179 RepID=A0A645G3P1_9ZZZZ
MIGASSEDIRLKDKLSVVPYGTTITKAVDMGLNESVKMVLDNNEYTEWNGTAGDFLNIIMDENAQPEKIDIYWKSIEHPAAFEIQLSSGGGQFITVYKGNITDTEKYSTYIFKKAVASDLRILITSGKATISEVKLDNVKR